MVLNFSLTIKNSLFRTVKQALGMVLSKRKGIVSGVLSLFLLVCITPAFARPVPDLPREIQAKTTKPVLLEFYATWCRTCQKMFPHIMEIKDKTKDKLQVIRLDIDAPENKQWTELYQIKGTPTYILFGTDKKATYIMEDMISSRLLETMIYREVGLLRSLAVPENMSGILNVDGSPFTFVAYHSKDCTDCEPGRALGKAIENHYANKIQFVELQSDNNNAAKNLFESMSSDKLPAYILMDSQARPLHFYDKPFNSKSQWKMLQFIDLVIKGQTSP